MAKPAIANANWDDVGFDLDVDKPLSSFKDELDEQFIDDLEDDPAYLAWIMEKLLRHRIIHGHSADEMNMFLRNLFTQHRRILQRPGLQRVC